MEAARDRFIGREEELEELLSRLLEGDRLITISGPPGIGKSRTARELARLFEEAEGGHGLSHFCDVSEATSSDELCRVVAESLGVAISPTTTPDEEVKVLGAALSKRGRLMLVVDNFEHLVDHGDATIGQWLKVSADLIVVATSRELLKLRGELAFALGPLEVTTSDGDSAAVELFIRRAMEVRAGFAPTVEERELITGLTEALEGNPLAIELAAGRMGVRSCAELKKEVDESLASLTSSRRDVSPRHASLGAAISSSWQLLSAGEQRALAQISVCPGSFSVAAATEICHVEDSRTVEMLLDSLRTKSLIGVELPEGEQGPLRFRAHRSVREFAAGQLAEGERGAVMRRHASYFLAAGEEAIEALDGEQGPAAFHRLCLELGNMRAVYEHSLASGEVESAARAALCMYAVLRERGPLSVSMALFDGVVAERRSLSEPVLGQVLAARGWLASSSREFDEAEQYLEQALEIAVRTRDVDLELELHGSLADHHMRRGNLDEVEEVLRRAEPLAAQHLDNPAATGIAVARGAFAGYTGDLEGAFAAFEPALRRARSRGDKRSTARLLVMLGRFATMDPARDSVPLIEESLAIYEEFGNPRSLALQYGQLGTAHADHGRIEQAREHFAHSLELYERCGDEFGAALAYGNLGVLSHLAGDFARAEELYSGAISIFARKQAPKNLACFMAFRAGAEASLGNTQSAERSLREAEASEQASARDVASVIAIQWGQVELAKAHAARELGEDAAAEKHLQAAKMIAAGKYPDAENERLVLGFLAEGIAKLEGEGAWYIAADGEAFRAPGGEIVRLAKRHVLRRLLIALFEKRRHEPGVPLTRRELAEAGWPGERYDRVGGSVNRLNVNLVRLRKLGLDGILRREKGGYLLDPREPIAGIDTDASPRPG